MNRPSDNQSLADTVPGTKFTRKSFIVKVNYFLVRIIAASGKNVILSGLGIQIPKTENLVQLFWISQEALVSILPLYTLQIQIKKKKN